MTVQGKDDVGIVVEDLAAVTAFFVGLGLELVGEAQAGGTWVDRVVGLGGCARRSPWPRRPTAAHAWS